MYTISKELFEIVMMHKYKGYNIDLIKIYDKAILYLFDDETNTSIDIDSFFFACKEWALSKGYNIWSDYLGNITVQNENFDTIDTTIGADTEQQAVFDACEYILRNLHD